tara:strand:- start:11399 stop:12214 length:816 start_codon:yes stop_codon:yes gene_type:complete
MNITLGIVKNIDFQFWLNSNEYYSSDILSTNVNTGINHAKKAGLIEKLVKNISSNGELVNLIDQRINLQESASAYSDEELLIIFDLIQAWGGPTGRNPYVFQNKPRITKSKLFASVYRASVEMLYQLKDIEDYANDVAPIKKKLEELPQVSESFSTKHLSFWSRFLKNCPELVIYDTRMREIIKAANKNNEVANITYKDFRLALLNEAQNLNLEINDIERAIFAFSSNYFKNDNFVLRTNPKINHPDKAIAHKLINDSTPKKCLLQKLFSN